MTQDALCPHRQSGYILSRLQLATPHLVESSTDSLGFWMATAIHDFSGIVSTADQSKATFLPLNKLDVYVSIVDVSSRVLLSQEYSHDRSDILSEAYYVFPVPARAAVCSFEMKANKGARLKGVVKELSQAKDDYQEALSKGLLGGLLEQFRQDGEDPLLDFTPCPDDMCSVWLDQGSIPPNTIVTILLSYVVDLSEDEEIDSIRFQFSSHVRARFGAPSNSVLSRETAHSASLSITVDIKMPGDILEVISLHHNPFVDLPVPTTLGFPDVRGSRHFTRKRFSSSNRCDLQRDFLLTVRAYGLGRPRCFAERLSREENKSRSVVGPTTALAFTIVPQFDFNKQAAQEHIFVIDRSSSMGCPLSMGWTGITIAKKTLQLLLMKLSTNSMFNFYSFGWGFYPMWFGSKRYMHATVQDAWIEADGMQANMGPGTRLLDALMSIFGSRQLDIPTSIFVLTDGLIYDIDAVVEAVRLAVLNATVAAPLRVFTLGMGSGASTELCQRIASAGNGACMMTVENEPLASKALKLVKAMEIPQVKEISIDWGHGIVDQVRQAPHRIGALSPGMRLLVTAIIPGDQVPTEVTLRLALADGTIFNYRIPVEITSDYIPESLTEALGGTITDIPPLIHTLAAHLLIQDIEGGDTQPLELQKLTAPSPETRRNIIKKFIVELGTQYQVASSRTAFVAVAAPRPSSSKPPRRHGDGYHRQDSLSKSGTHKDQTDTDGKKSDAKLPATSSMSAHLTSSSKQPSNGLPPHGNATTNPSGFDGRSDDESPMTPPSTLNVKSSMRHKTSLRSRSSPSHAPQRQNGPANGSPSKLEDTQSQSPTSRMPGAFKHSPDTGTATGPGWLFDVFALKPLPDMNPVEEVLCIPDPGGSQTIFTAPPLPHYTTITTFARSWLNSLTSFIFSKYRPGSHRRTSQKAASAFPEKHNASFPEAILTMSRLQAADGSFPSLAGGLSVVVGADVVTLRNSAPSMAYGESNEAVWATAVAIAFWEKRLCGHVELWEDQVQRARDFGCALCEGKESFENIVQEALKLLLP